MALFITLGLISRSSAKMLSLAQHADYAQHLSVYAVSCTVLKKPIKTSANVNFHESSSSFERGNQKSRYVIPTDARTN
jgi:hypothetical protein